MFYETVKELCHDRRTNMTSLARELGMSTSVPTSWKKGAVPTSETVQKVAEYFDVSVDYLLSGSRKNSTNRDISNSAVMQGNTGDHLSVVHGASNKEAEGLTEQEQEVIRIFRGFDMRTKTKTMNLLYQLEDGEHEKEV